MSNALRSLSLRELSNLGYEPATTLLAARAFQIVGGLLTSLLIVRMFGLSAAGSYALATLPAAALIPLCTLGLPSALARSTLTLRQRATVAFVASSIALTILIPVAYAYGAVIGQNEEEALTIAVLSWSAAGASQITISQSVQILQKRTKLALVTPISHLLALLIAAISTNDLLSFAVTLALLRLVGTITGFAGLRYSRVPLTSALETVKESKKFTAIDVFAAGSEFLALPLLSGILTRSELGLFGLARQFLMVGDTPGWSYVQSRYPKLVKGHAKLERDVRRKNLQISFLAAALTFIGGGILIIFLYRLPQLIPILVIMLISLPARYENNFCDQALRAGGYFTASVKLVAAKFALSTAIILLMAGLYGLYGTASAIVIASVVSAALYGIAYSRKGNHSPS